MKYRKKPLVVEAMFWDGTRDRHKEIVKWCGKVGIIMMNLSCYLSSSSATKHLQIKTLEGVMLACPGDWIIKGIAGEFYPCKNDIFIATYETVEA